MRRVACGAALLLAVPLAVGSAQAAFPGADGKVAAGVDGGLLVANPDGTGSEVLPAPDGTSSYCCGDATWSADGSKLAFIGGEENALWTIDVESLTTTRLTNYYEGDGGSYTRPSWSPDGAELAVTRTQYGLGYERIWRIGADGTGRRVLSDDHGDRPSWSPVGDQIVFTSWRDGQQLDVHFPSDEIYVMDADGEPETRLTDTIDEGAIFEGDDGLKYEKDPVFDTRPDWSPDGQLIAWHREATFTDGRPSTNEVWVMSATGANQRKVVDGHFLFWSPSGKVVYRNANGTAWAVSPDGVTGKVELVGFPAEADDWGPAPTTPNTAVGEDVVVNVPPATLTFNQVTSAGTTTVTQSGTGAPPPTGFRLGNPPTYFEITTTASYVPPIEVCIDYTGISFGGQPRLFHREDNAWVDRTTSVVPPRVCGLVDSLSPFALFEREPAQPPPPPPPPSPPPPPAPVPPPPPPPPPPPDPKAKPKPKKVTLCHRGRTIRVAKSAVRKHRKHGDKLGACRKKPKKRR